MSEALAFLTDEVAGGDLEVLDEELCGVVVEHRVDRSHGDPSIGYGPAEIHHEDGEAFRFVLELLVGRRAREKEKEVGVLGARYEDLFSVHDITVALPHGRRPQARRFRARLGLGHPERLEPELTFRDPGQVAALLILAPVPEERSHRVHLGMRARGVPA